MYLEGNELTSLPDDFFDCLPRLTWLDLRRNKLLRLPSVYTGRHNHLRTLLLEGNKLRSLPLELGTAVLWILDVGLICIYKQYIYLQLQSCTGYMENPLSNINIWLKDSQLSTVPLYSLHFCTQSYAIYRNMVRTYVQICISMHYI